MTDIWDDLNRYRRSVGLAPVTRRTQEQPKQQEVIYIREPKVKITEYTYILEEADLPLQKQHLLHGRAFVVDRDAITALTEASAATYYIAADAQQGLVVPGRAMSIYNAGPGTLYYRWTDDGDRWTPWVTLVNGQTDVYNILEKNRFAEIQVYASAANTLLSLRVSR